MIYIAHPYAGCRHCMWTYNIISAAWWGFHYVHYCVPFGMVAMRKTVTMTASLTGWGVVFEGKSVNKPKPESSVIFI